MSVTHVKKKSFLSIFDVPYVIRRQIWDKIRAHLLKFPQELTLFRALVTGSRTSFYYAPYSDFDIFVRTNNEFFQRLPNINFPCLSIRDTYRFTIKFHGLYFSVHVFPEQITAVMLGQDPPKYDLLTLSLESGDPTTLINWASQRRGRIRADEICYICDTRDFRAIPITISYELNDEEIKENLSICPKCLKNVPSFTTIIKNYIKGVTNA